MSGLPAWSADSRQGVQCHMHFMDLKLIAAGHLDGGDEGIVGHHVVAPNWDTHQTWPRRTTVRARPKRGASFHATSTTVALTLISMPATVGRKPRARRRAVGSCPTACRGGTGAAAARAFGISRSEVRRRRATTTRSCAPWCGRASVPRRLKTFSPSRGPSRRRCSPTCGRGWDRATMRERRSAMHSSERKSQFANEIAPITRSHSWVTSV